MQNSKNEAWDLDNLKLVLRFVDKDFSRYTLFIPVFKFSKSFLGLENKFSRYLKLNYHAKRYKVAKIANAVSNLICCGMDRFIRLDDEFRIERGLAKSLGFPNGFFSARTAYRFFRSFNGWSINQLEKINTQLLKEQKKHWYYKQGSLFIDLDMNTKSVEGKQIEKASLGYNRKRQGRLCLQWTVAHIAKVALWSALHTGKASGRTVLQEQAEHIERMLKNLGLGQEQNRLVWRIDGGYFSWDNLCFMNEDRRFITRVPKNLKVLKPYWKDKKLKRKTYSKTTTYTDLGPVHFPNLETDLRVVLLKVKKRKKVLCYSLCTNLFGWTAKAVVRGYRGRQIVENCFRDTNQAFYSNKLPSGSFYGNQAFLWFIVFAYNIFFFFQKTHQKPIIGKTYP